MEDKINSLETKMSQFLWELRLGKGVNEKLFKETISLLNSISNDLKDEKLVPKQLVLLLIDVSPSIISVESTYPEEEKEEIEIANDKLSQAIRNCFSD